MMKFRLIKNRFVLRIYQYMIFVKWHNKLFKK